jgi:hypothetical protein
MSDVSVSAEICPLHERCRVCCALRYCAIGKGNLPGALNCAVRDVQDETAEELDGERAGRNAYRVSYCKQLLN